MCYQTSTESLSNAQSSRLRPIFTLLDAQHAVTDVIAGNRMQRLIEVDLKQRNHFADNRLTSTNWWPR